MSNVFLIFFEIKGFSSSEYIESHKGFYKKIHQLIGNLMEVNNSISDNLVMDRLVRNKII